MILEKRTSFSLALAGHLFLVGGAFLLSVPSAIAVSLPVAPGLGLTSHAGWPLFFEPGPASPASAPTNFLARGPNYQLFVAATEVDFVLRRPEPVSLTSRREESLGIHSAPPRYVRMSFLSANSLARLSGAGEMEGKVNYLLGEDPARWRSQVSIFARVKVESLYPGVDVVYYGSHQQLEYDFTIAPRADAGAIAFRFEGIDKLSINPAGELVVGLGNNELRQHKPIIYQMVRGVRREVSGGYYLRDPKTVGFKVDDYDHEWALVIDPIFSYATYFGGNAGDTGLAIKVDPNGAVYLAGETLSTQFPAAQSGNPFQSQNHGGAVSGDAFVAKLDNTGSKLLYFTYLGGTNDDGAYDLAIDSSGNAYITGFTISPDFPTRNALFPHISGVADTNFHRFPLEAFVAELNTNGSSLIYSTFLGGSDKDVGSAIAVDPDGNAYVTGLTYSTNFPTVNPILSTLSGFDDVFVTKLAPGGTNLVYSTYLGGASVDEGEGIAVDDFGYAYVSGYTASTNFPITEGASQPLLNNAGTANGVYDAFVTQLTHDGSNMVYSTFLGGSSSDYGYRIAVDKFGSAYVTGATESSDFPHTNVFGLTIGEDGTNTINFDGFVTKLDVEGRIAYSVQFGGTANDAGWDVAIDPAGRAFVIGNTLSTNFPTDNVFGLFRKSNAGSQDIFVVALNTNGTAALYSGYLGGIANDYGYAIAVDSEANAYISGMTLSTNLSVTSGAFDSALSGSSDAFVAKIRLKNPLLNVQESGGNFLLTWPATAADYVLQSTPDLAPPLVWTSVSQTPVLTNGEFEVSLTITNTSTLFRLFRP